MTQIFLTGGSGFVGSHVAPALINAGHSVVALVRSPRAAADLRKRLGANESSLVTRIGSVNDHLHSLVQCGIVPDIVVLFPTRMDLSLALEFQLRDKVPWY